MNSYIEYRSIGDMSKAILRNLYKLPHDIDLIVGIPRSGMLPANLIALYMNKPFTDIDSFIEGRVYASGERGSYSPKDESNKILIMDDSLNSGNALKKAKAKLKKLSNPEKYSILWGVVYSKSGRSDIIDFYCEEIDGKRIFEWNIFHHDSITPNSYFDIDGVLCPNPPVDDDGPIYLNYISNAPVLYKPSVEVDTLVSCRLEKYRDVTEKWLASNGIRYKHLVMLPFKTRDERRAWGKHGRYKGELYKKSNAPLFIESSLHEAKDILKVSKRPVFCIETFEMMNNTNEKLFVTAKNTLKTFSPSITTKLRALYRFFRRK